MIVIVVDHELRYKVVQQNDDGTTTDVTEHWTLTPLDITVQDQPLRGFHLGIK